MIAETLVVAQCGSGRIDAITAELVSAAATLGAPVTLGVISADPASTERVTLPGIDKVVGIRIPSEQPGHEVLQRAVEALLEVTDARVVLMPFDWNTAAFAAALAEHHDLNFASDVIDVSRDSAGALIATRLLYGGKVRARLRFPAESATLFLLRPGVWPAAPTAGVAPAMEVARVILPVDSRVRLLRRTEAQTRGSDLTRAELIFAIGRGVGTPENIAVFADIARKFGGSLGASRPVVDAGLLPRAHQIGQSGTTVRPRLYVAFGISGAIQHLAGMRASKTIIAVNTDKDAPIFDSAHFGAHVDAMEVAKCLLAGP